MRQQTGKDGNPQVLTAVATTAGEHLDRFVGAAVAGFQPGALASADPARPERSGATEKCSTISAAR